MTYGPVDNCPNEAEDTDGFEDDDGCPEPDNDKDGLSDAKDKCPGQPETLNGNKDEDGCPDPGAAIVRLADGRIEPFPYYGGPGYPRIGPSQYFDIPGPLHVPPTVVTVGDPRAPASPGDYGPYTGVPPYRADLLFAPDASRP